VRLNAGVTKAFRKYLERAAEKLGSQAALASELGIDPTRVSRLKRGQKPYGRLNFENCLKLAAILDQSPPDILRAAGHLRQAALYEQLCGPAGPNRLLKSSEWQLLQIWRSLPQYRRAAFLNLMRTEGGPAATSRREFRDGARRERRAG
jgi:hypothetical protein